MLYQFPWVDGPEVNDPVAGTLLVDSGPTPYAGMFKFVVMVAIVAAQGFTAVLEHRDADNLTTLHRQLIPVNTSLWSSPSMLITLGKGERVRIIADANTIGRVQAGLFGAGL